MAQIWGMFPHVVGDRGHTDEDDAMFAKTVAPTKMSQYKGGTCPDEKHEEYEADDKRISRTPSHGSPFIRGCLAEMRHGNDAYTQHL